MKAAMKPEPFVKSKNHQVFKMEVYVMRKMQQSRHVCRLLLAGKMNIFNFVVMGLFGL